VRLERCWLEVRVVEPIENSQRNYRINSVYCRDKLDCEVKESHNEWSMASDTTSFPHSKELNIAFVT
jgi:hypothetical protein